METIHLALNGVGQVRRESLNGRDYLVAPLTLIVPGVLNGSKGPLYYPKDEIARDPASWNGMPLVIYHPISNDGTGSHVSGRDPTILSKQGVGHVYRAHIKDGGKLGAEGWFDIEHTRRVDPNVLSALQSGKPIELSTGLFTDNYPSGPGSAYNSPNGPQPYVAVARNYRPDHVAVLPDQIGACSIRDGCGVLINRDGTATTDPSPTPAPTGNYGHKPCDEYEDEEDRQDCEDQTMNTGSESPCDLRSATDNTEANFFGRFWAWVTNAPPNQPRSLVSGTYKHMGAGTGKGPAHEAAQAGAVALTDSDMEMGADACSQLKEGGHNPASWVEDEATWEKAKEAASKGDYGGEDSDRHWAVVTHIYKAMGGAVKTPSSTSNTAGDDTHMPLDLYADLLTNEELGANREFGSDEERRAAYWRMEKEGTYEKDPSARAVSTKQMKSEGGGGAESHTGRAGLSHRDSEGMDLAHGGKGTESHTGRSGPESHTGRSGPTSAPAKSGPSEAAKAALKQTASDATAHALNRTRLAKKAGGMAGVGGKSVGGSQRKSKDNRKAWVAHLDAAAAHEAAGSHHIAADHLKAADEHLAIAKVHEGMTGNESGLHTVYNVYGEDIEDMVTANEGFPSDKVRRGFFNHLNETGEYDPGMAGEGGKATKSANAASDKAESSGKASHHDEAANAHSAAAKVHSAAGNKAMASYHTKSAQMHDQAAESQYSHNSASSIHLTRSQALGILTGNCSCDGDRSALSALSDHALTSMARAQLAANTPLGVGGRDRRMPQDEMMGDSSSHDDSLETSDPEDAVDQGVDEDTEDEQGNPLPPKRGMPNQRQRAVGVGNMRTAPQPMTVNQWMAIAPPEIRGAVHNAMEIEKTERMKLVQALVSNVADPNHRKALAGRLLSKSIGELRDLSLLTPQAFAPQPLYAPQTTTPLFTGAAVGPVGNQTYNSAEDDDILPLPVMNWDEGDGSRRHSRQAYSEAE